MDKFVHETSQLINSITGKHIKIYKNVMVKDSVLENDISVGDDSVVVRTTFESNVAINRRNYINDSIIGKYTYTGLNTIINFSSIGRFCSIARNVDIGGINHDYTHVTTMPYFRYAQMKAGGGKLVTALDTNTLCEVGHDVWIAAGAQIVHDVNVGNGAVIAGGAVVTKDVPPYAIVAGVPAKIIGYRFADKYISALQDIQWWNWAPQKIEKYMEWIINAEMCDETIEKMQEINER